MTDFEKLGVFYLGREYDLAAGTCKPDLVLYDSKDLVTHAVCVGMTGSGKTGLCLTLLEEAAIDGIPAIVIDPKGDLSNLLLTFPKLTAEDFRPWVNEEDARKRGLTSEEFAKQQAELWRKGLAEWGQDEARIRRLHDAAEFTVYTPGSNAGLQVSVLKSFDAPGEATINDTELFRDRIASTVTSLLGLMGIDADPIQSREHILLSTIISAGWKEGRNVDLPALIQQIQDPPVKKIGVFDVEAFFPAKDRFGLAMQLNNLLAAPGFEAWMEGEPLDIDRLLHTAAGKPRIAIFSIAHLSDAERMFFVSLLLSQTLSWVRSQPGTTSLRALLYMDEIFGYFPPTANPPSKKPLLTLLKQARAFGVGVLLATQNPVDLDYKGLANAGTWFIGRLQTERDKLRVLEGLEGAAAGQGQGFDRQRMEETLAGLSNRVFLMNNVHDDAPTVFQVRWAMSYLRGPLTRQQIKRLMDERKRAHTGEKPPLAAPPHAPVARHAPKPTVAEDHRPVLPPDVTQVFAPVRSVGDAESKLVYQPALVGCAKIFYSDSKLGLSHEVDLGRALLLEADAVTISWDDGEPIELTDSDLEREPTGTAAFAPLPSAASKAKNYEVWKKGLTDALFRGEKLDLFKCVALKAISQPGESERDFRIRIGQSSREDRDRAVERLRRKYASKIATLQDRIRRAQQAVEREGEQAKASKFQAAISFGATALGALFGRKLTSASNIGKATTAARGVGRVMKETSDIGRAKENVAALQEQLTELEARIEEEAAELAGKLDPTLEELEPLTVKPKKTNITIRLLALTWLPHWQAADGTRTKAWE
jgi:hypothetical protein